MNVVGSRSRYITRNIEVGSESGTKYLHSTVNSNHVYIHTSDQIRYAPSHLPSPVGHSVGVTASPITTVAPSLSP